MNSNEINSKVATNLCSTYPVWYKKPCVTVFNVDVHIKDNPNDNPDLPNNYRNDLTQANNQLASFEGCHNIDKAQQFLSESGILGSTSSLSRDLITKTSRIHLDPTVQNQIRKTSLGLRFKKLGDHFSATIGSQKYIPHATISTSAAHDLRLQNIQIQVHHLKDTIETETTKILMLRAEVSKIKRALQDLIYANTINETNLCLQSSSLCVFCQQDSSLSSTSFRLHLS